MIETFLAVLALWSTLAHAQPAQTADHGVRRVAHSMPASSQDVDGLVNAVKSGSAQRTAEEEERRNAELSVLGNPDPKSKTELEPIYVKMLDDKDPDVQAAAAEGCGKLGASQVIPKVRAMLAAKTKHHFSRNDLGGASPADIRQAQALAKALASLGDYDSVDEILSRDEIMGVSGFGGPLVAAFGAKVLPKVVDVARKNDIRKGGALHAIAFLNDPAAIPDLVKLTHDPDPQIASAALHTLKRLSKAAPQASADVEAAYQAQVKNKDYLVRGHAYVGLLALDPEKYRSMIEDAIKNDPPVRTAILNELSGQKIPEIVPFLKQFIKDDEARRPKWTADRRLAARAIFRMTGEKVPYKGLEQDRQSHPDPYAP